MDGPLNASLLKAPLCFLMIYLVFPGSGKSLVINAILESKQDQYKTILINCYHVSTPHSIFAEIAAKLGLSLNKEHELNAADFQSASKKILLVQSCEISTFSHEAKLFTQILPQNRNSFSILWLLAIVCRNGQT